MALELASVAATRFFGLSPAGGLYFFLSPNIAPSALQFHAECCEELTKRFQELDRRQRRSFAFPCLF